MHAVESVTKPGTRAKRIEKAVAARCEEPFK
ncbi:hypothetical protein ABS735_19060 [Streptomyces sp. MMCC 100]